MHRQKLILPAILACACTTTIEGPPFDDGAAGVGAMAGSPSSGGTNASGGSSATVGGVSGTSSGASAGSSGLGGTGLGGSGFGGSGLGGTGGGAAGSSGATFGGRGGVGAAGSAASGSIAGAATGAGAGGASSSAFAQVSDIIVRTCASAMCHGGRRNPNLTAANLYTTLTSTQVRQCGNDRMVAARDTANSALLEVVNGQCGNLVMPEGCDTTPCLADPELTTITDWIAAGAPR